MRSLYAPSVSGLGTIFVTPSGPVHLTRFDSLSDCSQPAPVMASSNENLPVSR